MRRLLACLSLALALMPQGGAFAADWYTGGKPAVPDESWIVSVDSWATVTSTGSAFASMIGTVALTDSLRDSGARLRVDARGGTYRYAIPAKGVHITGQQEDGSVMLGYEWLWRSGSFAAYLGGNAQSNTLSPADPANPVVGNGVGLKAALDLYVNPTDQTMISANAIYSTLHASYYARARTGLAVWEHVFFGPELAILGDDFYKQWRVGLHVSGARFGPFEFGLSGGYLKDAVQGKGGYGTLDLRLSF